MALLSVERYRTLTQDNTTSSGAVTDAISDATALLEDALRRPLESAERTELVEVRGGEAFPLATPITAAGNFVFTSGSVLINAGVYGDMPIDLDPYYRQDDYPLTYTGGWTQQNLPVILQDAIAEIALALSRRTVTHGVVGATDVAVGDVRVRYGPSGASGSLAGNAARTAIVKYGRRNV